MCDSSGENSSEPSKSARRWEEAKALIPGGSQLLSKRVEMFAPEQWPAYYDSAAGATVTDLDGRTYVDMSLMGVGACVLGYADPDVNEAAHSAIDDGAMSTLNPPEEVTLAERLLDMHSWADSVRFGRPGGETVAIAVRLARAYTGNDTVAFCGYHGWHDWYLSANLGSAENLEEHLLPGLDPAGVPSGLAGTSKPFYYNDFEALERIAEENDLGAIVMEPIRYQPPEDDFLERVRELATRLDVPLIFDEITSGFRKNLAGLHRQLGVTPDLVVYGKALGNGFPISAVLGRERIMDEAQRSFISSTFWTERIGPSAALATIQKFDRENVHEHLIDIGERVTAGWESLADDHGLDIKTKGIAPLTTFQLADIDDSQAAVTLFTQEMLDSGFLATTSVYASYAHSDVHVDNYLDAVDGAFGTVADAIESGNVESYLDGPVKHTKFERLN